MAVNVSESLLIDRVSECSVEEYRQFGATHVADAQDTETGEWRVAWLVHGKWRLG